MCFGLPELEANILLIKQWIVEQLLIARFFSVEQVQYPFSVALHLFEPILCQRNILKLTFLSRWKSLQVCDYPP